MMFKQQRELQQVTNSNDLGPEHPGAVLVLQRGLGEIQRTLREVRRVRVLVHAQCRRVVEMTSFGQRKGPGGSRKVFQKPRTGD